MKIKNLSEIKGFEKFDNYNICENGQLFNSTTKKMLKGFKNKYGYITHTLSNTPISLTIAAHRLVALAFIENDNALIKTDVHHIDNDPSNNHINNLEWVSKSENISESTTKINVDTGDSKSKVQDVKKEVSSVDGKVSKVTFHTETAQASKNVTGLKKNISDYDKKNTGKTKTTKFNTITTQASKNVTGLKNNVSSFVRNYCKTFTTTFKVVTKYSTQGSPTPQSSGTKPTVRTIVPRLVANVESLQTRAIKTFEPYADNMPIMRSAMARVSQPTLDIDTLLRNTTRSNLRATQNTPIAIGGGDIADGLEFDIELLKELEAQLKLVSNQLSILGKKAEESMGQDKINYIKQQNQLYEEQQGLLKKQEEYLQRQQNYVKYSLENRGIKFNSDNNMTNYEEILLKKAKEVKTLEQKANKEKSSDADKKTYESAKSALDDLKKYADEYYSLTFDELPKVKEEWEDLANSIRENAHTVKDLEREQALYTKNSKLKEISVFQDEIADKQDLINEKMKHASGEEKVKYYKQLIALSETDMKHQELKIKTYKDSLAVLQKEMKGFGFTFDTNGSMENIDETLNKFQNSKDLEYVKKLMEEYITMQRNDLPEAEKHWQEITNGITDAKDAMEDLNKEADKFKFDTAFVSAQKHVDELNNALEMLDVRLENAFGQNKSELLQEKVDLLHKQKQEMLDVINLLKSSKDDLKGKLTNQGFNIDVKGNIRNYDSQMAKLRETMSPKDFAEVEQLAKSYLDLLVKEIPEAERKWTDLDNAIIEHQNQLEKVQRQIKLEPYLNKIKEIENEYDKFADKLDVTDIKLGQAYGQEKIDLLEKQMELLDEQMKKQEEMANQYKSIIKVYQSDLSEFGMKFDNKGNILNLDEILNKYQSHRDIEKIKDLVDEYLNIQRDKLLDVVKDWEKLNSTIKDAYKEQLEAVKDIEDEITKVYKKQVQDRIDLINKELDSRLDALGKEKKAYDDARKEADYKRDYEDQLAVVTELQKKIDIASKDTSLVGQKKLQDLLEQT